jgi:hypothetical protein
VDRTAEEPGKIESHFVGAGWRESGSFQARNDAELRGGITQMKRLAAAARRAER